jgi:hypothetical protein
MKLFPSMRNSARERAQRLGLSVSSGAASSQPTHPSIPIAPARRESMSRHLVLVSCPRCRSVHLHRSAHVGRIVVAPCEKRAGRDRRYRIVDADAARAR